MSLKQVSIFDVNFKTENNNKTKVKPLSIGEVAKRIGVEIHTIRFWTEEFNEYITFEIGKGDRRYYEESSILVFEKIKKLIHEQGIRIKTIKEKKLLLKPYLNEDSKKEELINLLEVLEKAKTILSKF